METQTIHPHAFMADFVNKYEAFIYPNLKKGNLDGIKHIIGLVCMKFGSFGKLPNRTSSKDGTYGKYRMAIQYLGGLIDEGEVDKASLQDLARCSDRWVAELDRVLWDDPDYKLTRNQNEKRIICNY